MTPTAIGINVLFYTAYAARRLPTALLEISAYINVYIHHVNVLPFFRPSRQIIFATLNLFILVALRTVLKQDCTG